MNVLMPNGRGFYPDFIIGLEGRKTEDGALLADPKERFEMSQEAPKALAEHQVYGRVMILAKDGVRWMTVDYDEQARKPVFGAEFRLPDAPGFGARALLAGKAGGRSLRPPAMPAAPNISATPASGIFPELAVVRLRHDLEEECLKAGERGTIVHVYEGGSGYEVEFIKGRERPLLVTVEPADIEQAD